MKKCVIALLLMIISAGLWSQDSDNVAGSKTLKRALSYQSMIKDSLGNPIEDGKYLITFRLYDSQNGTEPVWFENQNVNIYDGILNVLLGNKQRLKPGLFRDPLWLTLEMNGEESEKQYVSASSYSMCSGLVDLDAFAPSDNVELSLDPDGRIIIDVISPIPVADPDPTLNSIQFGIKDPDPTDPDKEYFEYLTLKNALNQQIGAMMYNIGSNWYKGGDENDECNDFVIYAKDGRDLVLKSDASGGNVYVGTKVCPNDLRVSGKIWATEVEVKLDVFPDYVFKNGYDLLSLSETEQFINENGHLPGMPSEKEVVENGLNINEMQLKLVEKIEELTLHMIKLEKENDELRQKMNSMTE